MAGKDPSFLFAGTSFNRKKFADVIDRFKVKKEEDDSSEWQKFIQDSKPPFEEQEMNTQAVTVSKKRKRKTASSESVEGFDVFKSSKSNKVSQKDDEAQEAIVEGKKEYYRQLDRDNIFRKEFNIYVSGSNIPSPLQSFADLKSRYKCKSYILRNLANFGFKEPTPIQRQAIPALLSGRECFACAPTGSGKTIAFVCPILMKLKCASDAGVRAGILCPTRELAAQTARESKKLANGRKFNIKLMTKQLTKRADFSKLPCDILISTPFRVQFAVRKRNLDLSKVEFLILDESDKLFDMGLVKQVDSVVKACSNPSILRSLFSATFPDTVENLARTVMHDAIRVIIGRKNSASESIKQKLVYVGSEEGKLFALRQAFEESLNPPVLVFVQNKERAKELHDELKYDDIRADVIHADLSEIQVIPNCARSLNAIYDMFARKLELDSVYLFPRENAVNNFQAGKTWVLIATDVIACGMDFKGINCVINYDFPESSSAYIHWIGRSGRASRSGEAITLFTEADFPYLKNIANIMTASGCEVPFWIMSKTIKQKWNKHRPHRHAISTKPKDEEEEEE